jgi:hypothetical protein
VQVEPGGQKRPAGGGVGRLVQPVQDRIERGQLLPDLGDGLGIGRPLLPLGRVRGGSDFGDRAR